jgi:hypothetical protein
MGPENPLAQAQREFLAKTFGGTLDGQSGRRVAEALLALGGGK